MLIVGLEVEEKAESNAQILEARSINNSNEKEVKCFRI